MILNPGFYINDCLPLAAAVEAFICSALGHLLQLFSCFCSPLHSCVTMTLTKLRIEKFVRTLKALLILLEAQSHFAFPAGPCMKERSNQSTSALFSEDSILADYLVYIELRLASFYVIYSSSLVGTSYIVFIVISPGFLPALSWPRGSIPIGNIAELTTIFPSVKS